jgi:hypothetical protein
MESSVGSESVFPTLSRPWPTPSFSARKSMSIINFTSSPSLFWYFWVVWCHIPHWCTTSSQRTHQHAFAGRDPVPVHAPQHFRPQTRIFGQISHGLMFFSLLNRVKFVLKQAISHGRNLGLFVFFYKSICWLCRNFAGIHNGIESWIAGFIGGFIAFGDSHGVSGSVNNQIVLYLFARFDFASSIV